MPTLTNPQIDEIEQKLGVALPGLYRKLLFEEGYGDIGDAAEIYDPTTISERCQSFFDDPSRVFHPYLPFGCHNRRQELWVIDASAERAASVGLRSRADDWPGEEWLEYDEWVTRYLDPIEAGEP
jgi:hypothetical protein